MEFIFELIFEIICEGTCALAEDKKVPMPLRILAFILSGTLFGGLTIGLIVLGFDALKSNDTPSAVMLFIVSGFLLIFLIHMIYKQVKANKEEDKQDTGSSENMM